MSNSIFPVVFIMMLEFVILAIIKRNVIYRVVLKKSTLIYRVGIN